MDQMTPDVESIFFAALQKASPEERAAYLNRACGGDTRLRQRVERLLEAHPKAVDSFLELPATGVPQTAAAAIEQPGAEIGPYTVLEKLGEGGFGVVYLAEQKTPVERRVALKILKPGTWYGYRTGVGSVRGGTSSVGRDGPSRHRKSL